MRKRDRIWAWIKGQMPKKPEPSPKKPKIRNGGDIILQGGAGGCPEGLQIGTDEDLTITHNGGQEGQVLVSQGAGKAPVWEDPSSWPTIGEGQVTFGGNFDMNVPLVIDNEGAVTVPLAQPIINPNITFGADGFATFEGHKIVGATPDDGGTPPEPEPDGGWDGWPLGRPT